MRSWVEASKERPNPLCSSHERPCGHGLKLPKNGPTRRQDRQRFAQQRAKGSVSAPQLSKGTEPEIRKGNGKAGWQSKVPGVEPPQLTRLAPRRPGVGSRALPSLARGGIICGQGPVIRRVCRARATGEARPVRVARPHPCCPGPRWPASMLPTRTARAVLPTHRPGSRSTPAPAPRARAGRAHPPAHAVHTASAPHWPAPAHPPQRLIVT